MGVAALSGLLGDDLRAAGTEGLPGLPHFAPTAKRVIYLFQSGAPSQMDLFDYKPRLRTSPRQELPESVRMGQRLTGMTSGAGELSGRAFRVPVPPARRIGRLGQRIDAAPVESHGRPLLHQVDVYGGHQSRSGSHFLPDRISDCRQAVDRRLAVYGLGSANKIFRHL